MNEKIRTNGASILAIVGLLFVGYVTFLQLCNHDGLSLQQAALYSSIKVAGIALVSGALQTLKATDKKFKTRIKIERILLIVSLPLFLGLMQSFIQFWNIQNNAEKIESAYQRATEYSSKLFTEYERYANKRIENYDKMLSRVIRNRYVRPAEYQSLNFTGSYDDTKRKNKVNALRTQLLSDNFKKLRTSAATWVDTNHKASVWNFFLQTNLTELSQAIINWRNALVDLSKKKVSDEEFKQYNTVEAFDTHDHLLRQLQLEFNGVKQNYLQDESQSFKGIAFFILAYVLLILPYFIQRRNPKSTYHLFREEKIKDGLQDVKQQSCDSQSKNSSAADDETFTMNEETTPQKNTVSEGQTESDSANDGMTFCMGDETYTQSRRRPKNTRKSPTNYETENNTDNSFTL